MAMKLSFFFVLVAMSFCVYAQQLKPIYFYGDLVISDSTMATSYGIYGKLSGEELYVLKTYDLANNLQFSGSYKDAELKIPHGNFVHYNDVEKFNQANYTSYFLGGKTRFISAKGAYVDGYKHGRWIEFYPDGKIMAVLTYVMGLRHGFFGTYNRRGKMIISGAYKLDKQDGEWLLNGGKLKQTFIDGVLQPQPQKSAKTSKQ